VLKTILMLLMTMPATANEQGEADARAAALAAEVVEAMGGRENYEATRFLTWRFFGRRLHVWDKHTGDHRVEAGDGLVVVQNLNTREGKAWQNGEPIEDEAARMEALEKAYSMWINDSYWLVMPYKLRDPGVNLSYTREDTMANGREAWVLTMTFEGVGETPQNKYEVFIDKETSLVEQWAFFADASDEEPRIVTPWANWEKHGAILLSADRGQGKHTDVAVLESVPEGTFSEPAPFRLAE